MVGVTGISGSPLLKDCLYGERKINLKNGKKEVLTEKRKF
jgi:hypothetical protein